MNLDNMISSIDPFFNESETGWGHIPSFKPNDLTPSGKVPVSSSEVQLPPRVTK